MTPTPDLPDPKRQYDLTQRAREERAASEAKFAAEIRDIIEAKTTDEKIARARIRDLARRSAELHWYGPMSLLPLPDPLVPWAPNDHDRALLDKFRISPE